MTSLAPRPQRLLGGFTVVGSCSRRQAIPLLVLVLLAVMSWRPSWAQEQVLPLGAQFQISPQDGGDHARPRAAMGTDGTLLVAWETYTMLASLGYGAVSARACARSGDALGDVVTLSAADPTGFALTAEPWAHAVLIWMPSATQNLVALSPLPNRSQVTSAGTFTPRVVPWAPNGTAAPAIAAGEDGQLLLVWEDHTSSDPKGSTSCIKGQLMTADLQPTGKQVQISSGTTGTHTTPTVVSDSRGGYLVLWRSDARLLLQRLGADGAVLDPPIDITSTSARTPGSLAVGHDGGFLVVWTEAPPDTAALTNFSIVGQLFRSDARKWGQEFTITPVDQGQYFSPRVLGGSRGGYLVVWVSKDASAADTSGSCIQGRRVFSELFLGNIFQINMITTYNQLAPDLTGDPNKEFVVVWESQAFDVNGLESTSIQGRRYIISMFRDGFESGSTAGWSEVEPLPEEAPSSGKTESASELELN